MTTTNLATLPHLAFPGRASSASLAKLDEHGFIVAALYTPSHAASAARLEASLVRFGLAYMLVEVPTVHSSMSVSGSGDPALTKPAFIRSVMDAFQSPVLYVDADLVFRSLPRHIVDLAAGTHDLAVYNWLADEHTDAFLPVTEKPTDPRPAINEARFFGFSHSVDYFDREQLICSGGTQFYANTPAARALLTAWAGVIGEQPGVADDECLDYAYNNSLAGTEVSASWLGKEYMRCAWWIYVNPIIDHPQFPSAGLRLKKLVPRAGAQRVYQNRLQIRRAPPVFPRDCIIDVQDQILYRIVPTGLPDGSNDLTPIGRLATELYLAP